jgi:hypothetical protein
MSWASSLGDGKELGNQQNLRVFQLCLGDGFSRSQHAEPQGPFLHQIEENWNQNQAPRESESGSPELRSIFAPLGR